MTWFAPDLGTELRNISLFFQAIGHVLLNTGLAVALTIAIVNELRTWRR